MRSLTGPPGDVYALVEEAGGGRGREKPWRATAAFTTLGDPGGDPARADARRRLDSVLLSEIYLEAIDRWLRTRADDPPEWREAAGYRDLSMPLTAAELTELRSGWTTSSGPTCAATPARRRRPRARAK